MFITIITSNHKTKAPRSITGKYTKQERKGRKNSSEMIIACLAYTLKTTKGIRKMWKNVYHSVWDMTSTKENSALWESSDVIFQGNNILPLKYHWPPTSLVWVLKLRLSVVSLFFSVYAQVMFHQCRQMVAINR